jgi:hypothetical protein
MANNGAKTILTPIIQKEIEQLIIAGNYAVIACASVGISQASYYYWQQRGREDRKNGKKSIYSDFSETIEKAEAIAESNAIIRVDKSARGGNVESAKWFLERKFYKRWGKNDKTEHTINGGLDLNINLSALTDEELEKMNAEIEQKIKRDFNNAVPEPIDSATSISADEGKNRSGKKKKK